MATPLERITQALVTRYEIEREIGAGGMATVYLARDLKHDRHVALKLLRPELGAVIGAERFLAEIRTTAKLQHSHILPLFDSGEADGLLFYVMPYVEGISLRERINREKQLAITDAVRIASEVAGALDYAHRHGVIHRDIKPENIMLHDGQALVADFGISLAISNAGSARMTETGMSLGTPHYMSPEQAMGERDITARSDVYALGAVAYEMLVGEPPFTGPTAQAIVARVVTETPRPLTPKRHTIPAHIEAAVLTALEKVPADRFASASDFAQALHNPGYTGARTAVTKTRIPKNLGVVSRYPVAVGAGLALLLIAGAFGFGRLTKPSESSSSPIGRFVITTPPDHHFTTFGTQNIALSPDGRSFVYAGDNARAKQLYLRKSDDLVAAPIPGTSDGFDPKFSVDGQWLTFWKGNVLWKIPVAGGSPTQVRIETGGVGFGFAVLNGDNLYFTGRDGALYGQKEGEKAKMIARPDSSHEVLLLMTDILPGGKKAMVIGLQGGTSYGRQLLIDLNSGERSVIAEPNIGGMIFDNGYVAWVERDGSLLGAKFNGKKITSTPITLAQHVRFTVGGPPQFAASKAGSIVYVPEQPFRLVYVDRAGKAEPVLDLERRFHSPRVSPNGKFIVTDFTQQNSRDVWILDLEDKTTSRLTFDNDGHDPVWSPDGKRVAYATARNGSIGMFMRNADGSGVTDSISVIKTSQTVGAFIPNSDQIVVLNTNLSGNNDIWLMSLGKRSAATPYLGSNYSFAYPAVSPDGKWLAYMSDESGQQEVYVRPLHGEGGKVLVSQNGGSEPAWARDGSELFYRGPGEVGTALIAAGVRSDGAFKVVSRKTLFDVSEYEGATPHTNYDVMPDGRFVMVHQGRLSEIVVLQNWKEEVRRRSAEK